MATSHVDSINFLRMGAFLNAPSPKSCFMLPIPLFCPQHQTQPKPESWIGFDILLRELQESGRIVEHVLVLFPDQANPDMQRVLQGYPPDIRHGLRNIPEHESSGNPIGNKLPNRIKLAGIMQDIWPESFFPKPLFYDLILIKPIIKHD